MEENSDRPDLYRYITHIVDDVRVLRPDMSVDDVESAIGPACALTLLETSNALLAVVADEVTQRFGAEPQYTALVGVIARFVRDALERES